MTFLKSRCKVLDSKNDFVAEVSHELRTPITIIKGFAETLQDLPELPRDMVVSITEKIVQSCQRMDALVKNLLILSDVENTAGIVRQSCLLGSLIESCREMTLVLYPEAIIVIEQPDEEIVANIDPVMLERALLNLLDNAAKYSDPPAHITVSLGVQRERVEIIISDQGIGIPSVHLDQIFKRFYAVNKSKSRKLGGAGLGLSIARTIVEKHQGTLSVISEEGKGTTFTISLPKQDNWAEFKKN